MQGDVEIRAYSMNNGSFRGFFRKGLKYVAIHEGSYAIYRDFIAQKKQHLPDRETRENRISWNYRSLGWRQFYSTSKTWLAWMTSFVRRPRGPGQAAWAKSLSETEGILLLKRSMDIDRIVFAPRAKTEKKFNFWGQPPKFLASPTPILPPSPDLAPRMPEDAREGFAP